MDMDMDMDMGKRYFIHLNTFLSSLFYLNLPILQTYQFYKPTNSTNPPILPKPPNSI